MLYWTIRFILGLPQRPGKTGKREVAAWLCVFWCFGAWRVGVHEAAGVAMPLTAAMLQFSFPFMVAALAAAFGLEQLAARGWLDKRGADKHEPHSPRG